MKIRKYKLKNILELQRGFDLTSSQMKNGKVVVAGSNGIIGYHDTERGNYPCITVGRTGSVGKVHFYDQPTWAHNTTLFVKSFKENNPRYLYYLLKNLHLDKMFSKGSSIVPSLNKKIVLDLLVPFHPNINDQNSIVSVLSTTERKIELCRAINHNLEAMAKQLYDYWFVQFDFPDENEKPYKSSGGKMVWNEKLKREIPVGWKVKTLRKCCDIIIGETPDTTDDTFWGEGYSWLNSGEVAEFPILKSKKTITKKGLDSSGTVLVPMGSVTLSIIRYLRPSILGIDACINQSVVAIKESDNLKKEYIYPLISREIPRLMTLRTGAQQPHINKETVESIHLIVPPLEVLTNYYDNCKPLYRALLVQANEIESLTKHQDELLPLLMSGQVSVLNSD